MKETNRVGNISPSASFTRDLGTKLRIFIYEMNNVCTSSDNQRVDNDRFVCDFRPRYLRKNQNRFWPV